MSKRFGRTRKREMRARLAQLQGQLDAAETHCRIASTRGQEIDRLLRDVERVMGAHTTALPAKTLGFSVPATASDFRLPELPKPLPRRDLTSMPALMEAIRLHILHIETSDDWHRNELHAHVCLDGVRVAYALSEQAIATTPTDVLTERITRELAKALVGELRRRGKHRAR